MSEAPAWLEHADLGKSALIVVDMQNDFCHENGSGGRNGGSTTHQQSIVPAMQNLIDAMHHADLPVFFIKTTHDKTTNTPSWVARQRNRAVPTCVTGTWGTEYYGVAPVEGDIEVIKHRYSAFIRTELELKLRALGVETLLMTGVATNGCVESTLRDGFMLDFFVLLITDGTAGGSPAAFEASLRNVSRHFGWLTDSVELTGLLDALPRPESLLVGAGAIA
jgi:ureidoacrylate peracid hydrolase